MKKAGLFMGLILLFTGLVLSALGWWQWNNSDSIFQFLLAMPSIAALGLAMIFFQGPDITLNQIKSKEFTWNDVMFKAPKLHMVIWALATFVVLGFTMVKFIPLLA